MKIKLFTSNNTDKLEKEINDFINGIEVKGIDIRNTGISDVWYATVMYEEETFPSMPNPYAASLGMNAMPNYNAMSAVWPYGPNTSAKSDVCSAPGIYDAVNPAKHQFTISDEQIAMLAK